MLNHIVIMGRLTRDPELRRTGSGIAVTSFTVAVDRDFGEKDKEKETDFIECVAWRQTGEFVSKYFSKGRMAVVSGRLQIRNWTDKEGNKRRSAEIIADNVYFGDSKRDDSNNQQGGYQASAPQQTDQPSQGGYQQPTPQQSYQQPQQGAPRGYAAYGQAPQGDFAPLEGDDAQLPF